MTYINQSSYKGLLGPRSKNIFENGWMASWDGKYRNVVILAYEKIDYDYLAGLIPYNFLYFDMRIFDKLPGRVNKSKEFSVITDISKWDNFDGKNWRGIRYCLNKMKNYDVKVSEIYNEADFVELIKKWRNNLANKYYQDHSGKNLYFFKMGFHNNCLNRFYYINDKMVGFACLSKPDENGNAAYIAGKSLCDEYYGLSEYVDCDILMHGRENGIKIINWGQGAKGVLKYKMKFPYSEILIHYNGKVENNGI